MTTTHVVSLPATAVVRRRVHNATFLRGVQNLFVPLLMEDTDGGNDALIIATAKEDFTTTIINYNSFIRYFSARVLERRREREREKRERERETLTPPPPPKNVWRRAVSLIIFSLSLFFFYEEKRSLF